MKRYLVLLSVLATLGAYAADPPRTDTNSGTNSSSGTANNSSLQTSGTSQSQAAKNRQSLNQEAKPNEIIGSKVSYSGIAVQLVKTDNPVQLINPAAPARYGSPEDNTLRDPIEGKVIGLKIFSIKF